MSLTLCRLPQEAATTEEALAVIDALREAVASGEIVAVAAVGIERDDVTRLWTTTTRPVTRLRIIGAMHHMLHTYSHMDTDET